MCPCPRGGGEKFLVKTEKKIQELQELSLLQLSMVEISFVLDTLLEGQPEGVYIGPRIFV